MSGAVKILSMERKRITTVYTGLGDDGKTAILSSDRVRKSSVRVEAYGEVDELNSFLGLACARVKDERICRVIRDIQNELFIAGSDLATPKNSKFDSPRITEEMRKELEERIEEFLPEVGELREFILPGGSEGAACLHLARAVCRRAERRTEALFGPEVARKEILVYLNRLSDLLFVLARVENKTSGVKEISVDFKGSGKRKK